MSTVFLDTNIFLHYKQFDQIDWLSVCSASECELVITPIVIDELDKHKIGNTKIGKRARNVLTQIEKLYETGNVIGNQKCSIFGNLACSNFGNSPYVISK